MGLKRSTVVPDRFVFIMSEASAKAAAEASLATAAKSDAPQKPDHHDQLGQLRMAGVGVSDGWTADYFVEGNDRSGKLRRRVESLWCTSKRHDHKRTKGNQQTRGRKVKTPFELWFAGPWLQDQIDAVVGLCKELLGDNCAATQRGMPNLATAA